MGIRKGWDAYEVRSDDQGVPGIYARRFNVRLATFAPGTADLQAKLNYLFETAHKRQFANAAAE